MALYLRLCAHPLIRRHFGVEYLILAVETTMQVADGRMAMRTRYDIWEPWRREPIGTN